MNYYELLGVPQDADASTIKTAFRKKAKKYHPDVNQGNAEAEKMFKDLNEAYSILSDEGKRYTYDMELKKEKEEAGAGFAGRRTTQSKQRTGQTRNTNPFANGFKMGFDFDEMMGAGMKFDKSYEESRSKKRTAPGTPDFLNSNAQFAQFFGFKPH